VSDHPDGAVNTVYLVRHGENPANLSREFSYKLVNYFLTEKGIRQAEQTAAYFASQLGGRRTVDAVYSSPLKRALQTAEIIGAATGHRVATIEELREVNVGSLEGRPPTEELWAFHDDVMDRWDQGEHDLRFPDGEDYRTLVGRARAALAEMVEGRSGQHIVAVTHGGIVKATMKDVCRDPDLDLIRRVPTANCAITEIEVHGAGAAIWGTLKRWSACDHLSD
jgi:broad specificity phosphatase PhoE